MGLGTLARSIFGTPNDRKVKSVRPLVEAINAREEQVKTLTDQGLKDATSALRERARNGEDLDALLPETFALVREAARRALGLRGFDVQLVGGIFLHQGNIAEMKTGEGKTLFATFPATFNALAGQGVHDVTVYDLYARSDAEWMGMV